MAAQLAGDGWQPEKREKEMMSAIGGRNAKSKEGKDRSGARTRRDAIRCVRHSLE